MNDVLQKYIHEGTAVNIAEGLEKAVRDGRLAPGTRVPTIRALAEGLGVSPTTVSTAYRTLHARGVLVSRGRAGTSVSHRPMHGACCRQELPDGVRILSDGNPDAALLPGLSFFMAEIDASPVLYGAPTEDADLVRIVSDDLRASGVHVGDICVLSGAMDAMERVLAEHLRPGDRVAVEDPGFGSVFNLAMSRGLSLAPLKMDEEGVLPDSLEAACRERVKAVIITPRAQTPTGAFLTSERASALRRVLRRHPDVLLIEDDHANIICDAPLHVLHERNRPAWAHIRSFAKPLGPDLRLAVVTGDDRTVARLKDRLVLGCRWVSHVLQRIVLALLRDQSVRADLRRASQVYAIRRTALIAALGRYDIEAQSRSGFNVWIPVPEESTVVQSMLSSGWSIAAGERFRIASEPAVRITTATLKTPEAEPVAACLARIIKPVARPVV